jgi:hypothetical protein
MITRFFQGLSGSPGRETLLKNNDSTKRCKVMQCASPWGVPIWGLTFWQQIYIM